MGKVEVRHVSALFFTPAVDGEWSASRTSRFIPGERDPGTHWIGDQMRPRSGFERCGVEKDFFFAPVRNKTPVVLPVARCYM
jgi:hypothetical protein